MTVNGSFCPPRFMHLREPQMQLGGGIRGKRSLRGWSWEASVGAGSALMELGELIHPEELPQCKCSVDI